jgi:hypothetical protein
MIPLINQKFGTLKECWRLEEEFNSVTEKEGKFNGGRRIFFFGFRYLGVSKNE